MNNLNIVLTLLLCLNIQLSDFQSYLSKVSSSTNGSLELNKNEVRKYSKVDKEYFTKTSQFLSMGCESIHDGYIVHLRHQDKGIFTDIYDYLDKNGNVKSSISFVNYCSSCSWKFNSMSGFEYSSDGKVCLGIKIYQYDTLNQENVMHYHMLEVKDSVSYSVSKQKGFYVR